MTTPRDDIAGLIERLRKWNDEWPHWKFTAHQHDALRLVLDYSEQAATQLAALNKELAQTQAHLAMRNSDLAEAERERDALSARVKELEGQLAEADATLLKLNGGKELQDLMRLNNDLQARATRLQQERDEAYERAAKVAEDNTPRKFEGTLAAHVTGNRITAAIRQLAKEKP